MSEASQNKVYNEAMAKYAACLRRNGADVIARSHAGGETTLDTKGVDTSSPSYEKAKSRCSSTLDEALRSAAGKAYEESESSSE